MENNEFLDLAFKDLKFDTVTNFKDKLEKIFERNLEIPLIGYSSFDKTKYSIYKTIGNEEKILLPLTKSDKLTIENYIEGIKKAEEEYKSAPEWVKFKGEIYLTGFEDLNEWSIDKRFFTATVQIKESLVYCLDLFLSTTKIPGRVNDRLGYAAESRMEETKFDKIMSPHIGPNKKYTPLF